MAVYLIIYVLVALFVMFVIAGFRYIGRETSSTPQKERESKSLAQIKEEKKLNSTKKRNGTRLPQIKYSNTQSPIEDRLFSAIKILPNLPLPVSQFEIRNNGRLVTVPDFAYPKYRIAIYCDGFAHHGNKETLEMDAKKRNWLQQNGWLVLTYWGRTINKDAMACAIEIRDVYIDRSNSQR